MGESQTSLKNRIGHRQLSKDLILRLGVGNNLNLRYLGFYIHRGQMVISGWSAIYSCCGRRGMTEGQISHGHSEMLGRMRAQILLHLFFVGVLDSTGALKGSISAHEFCSSECPFIC